MDGVFDDVPQTIARSDGEHGEVVLRRRGEVTELIVNGAFAMDDAETRSERELARCALRADGAVTTVLVGGLGLGVTVAELLRTAPDLAHVEVVEREPALVRWAAAGLLPSGRALSDPRVAIAVADVRATLTGRGDASTTSRYDAVLLDVDNGPDFLIHADNAALYEPTVLRAVLSRLRPGGVLAIWCQGYSAPLATALATAAVRTDVVEVDVTRGRHAITYAIHLAWRDGAPG